MVRLVVNISPKRNWRPNTVAVKERFPLVKERSCQISELQMTWKLLRNLTTKVKFRGQIPKNVQHPTKI